MKKILAILFIACSMQSWGQMSNPLIKGILAQNSQKVVINYQVINPYAQISLFQIYVNGVVVKSESGSTTSSVYVKNGDIVYFHVINYDNTGVRIEQTLNTTTTKDDNTREITTTQLTINKSITYNIVCTIYTL